MKAIHFFYVGAGLDMLMLLAGLFSFASLFTYVPEQSRINIALMVIFLLAGLAWLGLAFWLKNKGKMLVANILVWLPAAPVLMWAGLALIFVVASVFSK
jgi:hypothetical protein